MKFFSKPEQEGWVLASMRRPRLRRASQHGAARRYLFALNSTVIALVKELRSARLP